MMGLFAAVRALHFASLMGLWGVSIYLWLIGRTLKMGVAEHGLKRAMVAGAILALVTGIFWLVLVTGQMTGDWRESLDPQSVMAVLGESRFGRIWLGRLFGLGLLVVLGAIRVRMSVMALVAGATLASLGPVSHAAASGGPLRALNDAVHLLTAGFWVGGLLVLAELCRVYRHDLKKLAAPFALFSFWGVYAVALLVLSGLANAAMILPLHAMTPENAYADVLALKIVLAFAMIGLAVVNRSQLLPALRSGEKAALFQLARNVAGEIALGLAVIGIVGYLGLMPPS